MSFFGARASLASLSSSLQVLKLQINDCTSYRHGRCAFYNLDVRRRGRGGASLPDSGERLAVLVPLARPRRPPFPVQDTSRPGDFSEIARGRAARESATDHNLWAAWENQEAA